MNSKETTQDNEKGEQKVKRPAVKFGPRHREAYINIPRSLISDIDQSRPEEEVYPLQTSKVDFFS